MKRFNVAVLSASLVLGLSAGQIYAETPHHSLTKDIRKMDEARSHTKDGTKNYAGSISKVDTKSGFAKVKLTDGKTVKVPLHAATVTGKIAKTSELAAGQKVEVQERLEKGRVVSSSINVA